MPATMADLHLRDPSTFKPPFKLDTVSYYRLQAKEKLAYDDALHALPDDKREMRTVDKRYLEAMMPLFTRIGYQEKSVARYIAQAVHTAPSDDIRVWASCQMVDEAQHAEMDDYLLWVLGVSHRDTDAIWAASAAKPNFDYMESLTNPYQIVVEGNLFVEGGLALGNIFAYIDMAKDHGDELRQLQHKTRCTDEARHIAFGFALAEALIADDPENLVTIQAAQDEALPRLVAGYMKTFRPVEQQLGKDGYGKRHLRAAAERYYAKATRLGLRPTAIPELDLVY